MYVHRDPDLTFLAMERTASRAVASALKELGFELVGDHHHGPEEGLEVVGKPFTVVRNHWDWVASHWWGVHANLEGPYIKREWLIDRIMGNPSVFRPARTFRFLEVPDVVPLRFEALQDEVDGFLGDYGFDIEEIPVEGASEERDGTHFVSVFTPHAARFVAWLWYPEIRELGYRFSRES